MIKEDEGFLDITSEAIINNNEIAICEIISKDYGILAGINLIIEFLVKNNMEILFTLNDGDKINKGDIFLKFKGNASKILLFERTILNILMRMSAVATEAFEINTLVKDYNVIIAGTRKTSPGIAKFDKLALKIGGADTHRFSLDDMVLIKDNHIAMVGTPLEALLKAKNNVSFSKKIEIEVETFEDAILCVKNKADIVMLDNMDISEIEKISNELNSLNIRSNSLIEVSGGINKDNILDYAKLDIDIISLGALTHSVNSLDFSLRLFKN